MFRNERWTATALWAALAAATVAAGFHYMFLKGVERSAFNRWRPQLHALARGENIYETRAFPTPPVMAAILLPFAKLEPRTGMAAWFAAKALGAACVAVWLARAFAGPRPPPWLAPAGLALAAPPILGDLQHGNVNLLILFLTTVAWLLHRQGRDFRAGATVALAAACKVTPALLAVYFAWQGRWRAVVGVAAGAVLWLLLVPGAVFGQMRNVELLGSWRKAMLAPFVERGEVEGNEVNQSLPGLVRRALAPVVPPPWAKEPPTQVNVANWAPRDLRKAVFAACGAVAGAWLLATFRGAPHAHFCLTLLAMLALSERSWKHHYVMALPGFLLLLAAGRTRPWLRLVAGAAAGLLLACAKDLVGSAWSDGLQARGAYLWAAGLLAFGVLCAGRTDAGWAPPR